MHPSAISAAEAETLFAPLRRYPRLAVAVSGGPDSLALLHLLARWRGEAGSRPELTVLTVDHGLRPQSRGEAEMVGSVAAGLGLPHATLTWDDSHERSGGLQERARAARYDLMASYCHAHSIPMIVTAHHLDDQAETFLMRLKRGSGLDGLAAIPEESVWAGIAVLRPLLDMSKARLLATLKDLGLAWAEDPSNKDRRFERARVRASGNAFAKLGLSPDALARSAKRLRRARAALERSTDDFLAEQATVSEAGYCLFAPKALEAAPAEIALRALARVLAAVGGRTEPIRLSKLEALLAALELDPKKTHTLGGCRITSVGPELGIFRETRGAGLPEIELRPGERALWDNRFRVELGRGESRPVIVRALGKDAPDHTASLPWLEALPRFARITLPACVREEGVSLPRLGLACEGAGRGFHANFVGGAGVLPSPPAR
jgi:tRNA(Ile)-lysidine synthase